MFFLTDSYLCIKSVTYRPTLSKIKGGHHVQGVFFNWASPLDWPPPNLLGLPPP